MLVVYTLLDLVSINRIFFIFQNKFVIKSFQLKIFILVFLVLPYHLFIKVVGLKIPRKSNPGQFFIQSFKQQLQFIITFRVQKSKNGLYLMLQYGPVCQTHFMLLLIFSTTLVSTAKILQCHYEQITSGILYKADGTLVKRRNIEIENTL